MAIRYVAGEIESGKKRRSLIIVRTACRGGLERRQVVVVNVNERLVAGGNMRLRRGGLRHPTALAPNAALPYELQRIHNGRRCIRFTISLCDIEFRHERQRKAMAWPLWCGGRPTLEVLLEYFRQAMTDQPIDRTFTRKVWMPAVLELGQRRPAPVQNACAVKGEPGPFLRLNQRQTAFKLLQLSHPTTLYPSESRR